MDEIVWRLIATFLTAFLLLGMTGKMMGALQQSGYQNKQFIKWLKRKDNLAFNRLWVFSLTLALLVAVFPLSFSFLGKKVALLLAGFPYVGAFALYYYADGKYALKVALESTGRVKRLFIGLFVLLALVSYSWIALLFFLAKVINSPIYGLLAYVPVALLPMGLPYFLVLTNKITSIFENRRNAKFVKRAGQVLDETQMIRIGIVGSYGKTSVKNILATLLSEKYAVVASPASYNTPIGIAKTVFSSGFCEKQIFIAEMGARKEGDIVELCQLVKPDYAILTGICEQHVQGFGSIENVWKEKSQILAYAKKTVCRRDLADTEATIPPVSVKNAHFGAMASAFELSLYGEWIPVRTKLLGKAGMENIALAVALCVELGLTAEEIVRGIEKLEPIPHRLSLMEKRGIYILDDGYNSNPVGAREALEALKRFGGRKCVVTPGLVECGVLEEKLNGELGAEIAEGGFDKVILVGETLVGCVKNGYLTAGGDAERLTVVKTLADAQTLLGEWLERGDAVLFLNDLPDVY